MKYIFISTSMLFPLMPTVRILDGKQLNQINIQVNIKKIASWVCPYPTYFCDNLIKLFAFLISVVTLKVIACVMLESFKLQDPELRPYYLKQWIYIIRPHGKGKKLQKLSMQCTPKAESKMLFIIFFKDRIDDAMIILEFFSLGKDRIIVQS